MLSCDGYMWRQPVVYVLESQTVHQTPEMNAEQQTSSLGLW